ncbi:hypothetical protein B0H14DRAFT_2564768 [Mycena olivaceomarginata]|nr:hypothetical protein B0H14DRAFT_2564768 [Mycena olivaceomarginata]
MVHICEERQKFLDISTRFGGLPQCLKIIQNQEAWWSDMEVMDDCSCNVPSRFRSDSRPWNIFGLDGSIETEAELGRKSESSWDMIPTSSRRPAGYTPTLLDFGAYVQQRDAFPPSLRGRAALFYGGIVGRLARLVIPDLEDVACLDPPADVLEAGDNEINLVCGVYTVETGQTSKAAADGHQLKYISWWPTPTAFWSSGLNTGRWNANCERWFVKRSREMETMRVKLFTYGKTRSSSVMLAASIEDLDAKAEQRGSAEVCRLVCRSSADGLPMICGWV